MFFRPNQIPRSVLAGEFVPDFIGSVMTGDSISDIISMTYIETPGWILKNVHPEHGKLAPAVGFEPTTNRLTADRSTTELRWIAGFSSRVYILPCDSAESTLDRLIPTASGLYH